MKTKLFISSDLKGTDILSAFCAENEWELSAESLIDFQYLNFIVSSKYEVVFFSSPRSFNYFIRSENITNSVDLAVIGKGTLQSLNEWISRVSFVGENSGNPQSVAEDFKTWLGERRVLFPVALHSNETISSLIPASQKEVVRVYETIPKPVKIPVHDFYVFTSPSNVMSFLSLNKLPATAKIVAWGKTTENACVQNNLPVWKTLKDSSLESLVEELRNVC
jgi:uroporphyrinogen-III synthase